MSYLLESGQDPAQRDSRGRPAYLLASHKAVRDVFRRCALPACSLSPLAFLWTPQQAARYRLPAVTWLVVVNFLDSRPTCLRHIHTALLSYRRPAVSHVVPFDSHPDFKL